MYTKTLVLLLMICLPSFAEERSLSPEIYTLRGTKEKVEESTVFMNIGLNNRKNTLVHNESASEAGYFSLDESHSYSKQSIELIVNKEFLSKNRISLTVSAKFGKLKGKKEGSKSNETVNYKDEVSGYRYGPGLSVNLNTRALGLKIQPFFQAQYLKSNPLYDLSYTSTTSPDDNINILYDSELSTTILSLGVRLFDFSKGMMSYFSADYFSDGEETMARSGTIRNSILTLNNSFTIERESYGFSVGLGFLF